MHISMQESGEKTIKKQAHTFILKEIILTKPDIHLKSKAYESKHLIVIEYVQARSNLYSAMSKHKPPPLLWRTHFLNYEIETTKEENIH